MVQVKTKYTSNDFIASFTKFHFQKSYQKSPSFEGVENKTPQHLKRLLAERGFVWNHISVNSIFKYILQ